MQVTFAVARSWKGADQATIVVNTPTSSASCGVGCVQDQAYLVYARDNDGRLETNGCSRTTQLELAGEDLAVLGAGSTPLAMTQAAAMPSTLPATGGDTASADRWLAGLAVGALLIGCGTGILGASAR